MKNRILTFDIEEWFHILDNPSTQTENEWIQFESRIHLNMDRIFDLLERSQTRATFFCVGWIAKQYPEVIKAIAGKGFEIGSHSDMHQLVYQQNPKTFSSDLENSIKTLEDLTGKKVTVFRAPGFSITEKNKWAFEILARFGITLDCSIFPASRAHGGFPSFQKAEPSKIRYNGIELKELPINYVNILNREVIFSGGGYFRFFPYPFIKKWTENSDYVMTYFHPRDFDPQQPVIKDLSPLRKFKSYVGLKKTEKKLEKWLTDFHFTDIATAREKIDWDQVPVVDLNP